MEPPATAPASPMLHRIRHSGNELLSPDAWKTRLVFWTGAVVVGGLAVAFAEAAEIANDLFLENIAPSPWLPFLVCPAGLMLIAWLTRRYVPGAAGSGIPQAIAAIGMTEHVTRTHLLSFKIAFSKIGLCLMGLLSGASIGREGPTVHVGAAIMFSLGRFARFPHHYMDRGLILAGGAAGIAAAFNTPLAGILFAIEELGRSFEERTSGVLLTAVFLAGIMAVALQGNYSYFGSTDAHLMPSEMFLPILVCGIGGGLFGGLFAQALIWSSRRLPACCGNHPLLVALACGLILAAIGLAAGGLTYGTGYREASQLVTGTGELPASYAFLKMAATWISYLSGIPGGIFAPSLAAGAGVGSLIAEWFPALPFTAIVILGMVGYFTGVVQTPITALVIVMEMTGDHGLVLPLMATAFLAHVTSRVLCPEPIYRALAANFLPPQPARSEEK